MLVRNSQLHTLVLQFGGSLIHLSLKPDVGFLELAGHVVELARQGFEFVAGTDDNRLVQLSCRELHRTALDGLYWIHHVPCHIKTCHHGERQPCHEQQARTLQRLVQGCKSFGERLLHQHCPVERCNAHIGGEHLLALGASRNRNRRPPIFIDAPGCTNLRQLGEVLLLQDIADIRMRDQLPTAVDHIGEAFLADADAGNNVPYKLQVDLRQRDGAPDTADGDSHVGLAAVAKVDGAEIRFARPGLQKSRVVQIISTARRHVHTQPGDVQLLFSRGVNHGGVCDGRHHTQQLQVFDPPLLRRLRAGLRQAHPGELTLDLLDVGFDAGGRRVRLLLLQRKERLLVFLVSEIELHASACYQRQTNQPDEKDHILPKKRTAQDQCHRRQSFTGSSISWRY